MFLGTCQPIIKNGNVYDICERKISVWSIVSIAFACIAIICLIGYIVLEIKNRRNAHKQQASQYPPQVPQTPPLTYPPMSQRPITTTPLSNYTGTFSNSESLYATNNTNRNKEIRVKEFADDELSLGSDTTLTSTPEQYYAHYNNQIHIDGLDLRLPEKSTPPPLHKI